MNSPLISRNGARPFSMPILLLPMLLLLICDASSAPVTWRDLAGSRSDRGVLKETGYPAPLFDLVWHRYGGPIVAKLSTQAPFPMYTNIGIPQTVAILLYVAVWYIHLHPVMSAIGQRDFPGFGRVTEDKFYNMVFPVLYDFSMALDEIHYNDRLHPSNHGTGPIFSQFVTLFVDCAPVYVVEPKDEQLQKLLIQPKYGAHVYKIQVAVNFLGWICMYTGLHHGTVPDNVIYNNTQRQHPLRSWEFWCGDGIYESCYGVLTRFILAAGAVFTRLEVFMNTYINHYRQRVEHVMHTIKDHAMWNGQHLRCSYAMLDSCMRLTVQLTNMKIKHAWEDEAYHKYQGYHRPWPAGP